MVKNSRLMELLKAGDLVKLETALKENIREESQKASGIKSSDGVIIRRLMAANKTRAALQKQHDFTFAGVNYHGITDGHYILASAADLGYEPAEGAERLKMEKLFSDDCDRVLTLDAQEVKMYAKENKKSLLPYVIESDGVIFAFNAQFLADCIDFTQTDVIHYSRTTGDRLKTPVQFIGGDRCALLLPVNVVDPSANIQRMDDWRRNK